MLLKDRIRNKIYWSIVRRKQINPKSYIDPRGLIISDNDNFTIGDNVYIGPNATIYCGYTKVEIKNDVVIGPGLTIIENDHEYRIKGKSIKDSGLINSESNKITIESDTWLGANVTILKGVTIGRGAIVAACACVTKDIEPYTIVGGVPAKEIRKRFSPEEIEEHERILYGE